MQDHHLHKPNKNDQGTPLLFRGKKKKIRKKYEERTCSIMEGDLSWFLILQCALVSILIFFNAFLSWYKQSWILLWLYFFLFTATPAAYGSSRARDWTGAAAGAYDTATAMLDPSHICNLHQILNPLSEAKDWTHILMDTSRFLTRWATTRDSKSWMSKSKDYENQKKVECLFNDFFVRRSTTLQWTNDPWMFPGSLK